MKNLPDARFAFLSRSVSPLLALLFSGGIKGDEDMESSIGSSTAARPDGGPSAVALEVGGVIIETTAEDAGLILVLRRCIRRAVLATATCDECPWLRELRASLRTLLAHDESPWANVPPNWQHSEDESGNALYRSMINPSVATRIKPTEDAVVVAERARIAKKEFERYKAEGFGLKSKEPPKELSLAEKEAEKVALQLTKEKMLVQKKKAEEMQAVEDKRLREIVIARAKGLEAREKQSKNTVAYSLHKGLSELLKELDLEFKMGDFAAAGFGDEELMELGEAIDEDKKIEGAEAFDAMVSAVGLRGGSVVKLKRRLFEHGSSSKKAAGGDAAIDGSGKGKGKGKGAAAPSQKAKGGDKKGKPKFKSKDFEMPDGMLPTKSKKKN